MGHGTCPHKSCPYQNQSKREAAHPELPRHVLAALPDQSIGELHSNILKKRKSLGFQGSVHEKKKLQKAGVLSEIFSALFHIIKTYLLIQVYCSSQSLCKSCKAHGLSSGAILCHQSCDPMPGKPGHPARIPPGTGAGRAAPDTAAPRTAHRRASRRARSGRYYFILCSLGNCFNTTLETALSFQGFFSFACFSCSFWELTSHPY